MSRTPTLEGVPALEQTVEVSNEPFAGICPECGGLLRNWAPGRWECIGRFDPPGGCGFAHVVEKGGAA